MSARCATVFATFVATGSLLATVGGTTPHYIWNASNSVPIVLYHVQPVTRLTVTELVAVQPPDLSLRFSISMATFRSASPCSSAYWRCPDKRFAETA
jgi:type IV secretory pathway protease TraF